MLLIDTHAHLYYDNMYDNLSEVLSIAESNNVKKTICIGTDLETSLKSVEIAEQYENVYLKEIEQNKSLIEKNKTSYDLVAEAEERSEAEKTKLKIAAYSLTSQMDLIKGLLESTDQKKNRSQVEYIRDRILDVSFNLLI